MAKSSNNNRGLGRGLSALMADVAPNVDTDQNDSPAKSDLTVPIEAVFPNPDQPRRSFDDAALQELAESIREKGIIQPIVVRLAKKDGQYEIVAGRTPLACCATGETSSGPGGCSVVFGSGNARSRNYREYSASRPKRHR